MDAVGSGGGLNRFGAWVGQIVTIVFCVQPDYSPFIINRPLRPGRWGWGCGLSLSLSLKPLTHRARKRGRHSLQQKSGVCLIRSVAASFSKETTFATTRTTTATHAVTLCSRFCKNT